MDSLKHIAFYLLILALLAGLAGCRERPAPPESPEPLASSQPVSFRPESSSPVSSAAPPSTATDTGVELHAQIFPVGMIGVKNFIDHERETYDGTMLLEVPRMDFSGVVLDGVTDDVLKDGAGLFPQGQLPGPENRNVCIAAHRDIDGGPFMDIDKITEGDLFYLTYQGKKYTYEYVETMITEPDDWEAVKVKEYSAISLMSCDPPWTNPSVSKRMFAIGRLISIETAEE